MKTYYIKNEWVSLEKLEEIISSGIEVHLSEETKAKIQKCRSYLDEVMQGGDKVIYGINTGFGSLCDTVVAQEELEQLQRNLVLSHACGAGEEVPQEIVKRMLLLKVMGLSHGQSGVQ